MVNIKIEIQPLARTITGFPKFIAVEYTTQYIKSNDKLQPKNISGIVATILSENNAEKCITFVMHVNDKLKINYYLMGLGRLELPTLRLSDTHSNQLSYKP